MSSTLAPRRSLLRPVVGVLIALALLAAAYVGAAWFLGGRLPRTTTVSGVELGGKEPAAARAALTTGLAGRTQVPLTVQAEGRELRLVPAQSGLGFDVDATIKGLSGFTLDPRSMWAHLTGKVERDPVVTVDRPRLASAVSKASTSVNQQVKEGRVAFTEGKVVAVTSVEGRQVDAEKTADAIARAWPASTTVAATVDRTQPELSASEIARFRKEVADPLVSGPITVAAGGKRFPVAPAAFTPALSVKNDKGRLTHVVDHKKIVAAVEQAAQKAGVVREARSARVSFSEGQPVITPSAAGQRLKTGAVAEPVVAALTAASRTAAVPVEAVQPRVSTDRAKATLPKGLISVFSTTLTSNADRTENISIAARTLNGTYVGPGEQFSLNDVLGERTAAKGYNEAPVIMNGRLAKDYGGGTSQLSTTVLNAAFFAGVQLDDFTPHSFYISRYPEGREATISWPNLDQKWTNTTDGGILIRTSMSGGKLVVSFSGTKTFDVTTSKGPRRNVVSPRKITDNSSGCVPQAPSDGFDVTVTRTISKGGAVVKTESFDTHYIPEDHVVCTHPDAQ